MLKHLMVLCAFSFFVLVMGLYTYSFAGSEKGAKKCSDTIDNDGDGLIDANDPDCGGLTQRPPRNGSPPRRSGSSTPLGSVVPRMSTNNPLLSGPVTL